MVVSSFHMSERAGAAKSYHRKILEGFMANKGVFLHAIKVLRKLYAGKIDAANLLKSLHRYVSEPGYFHTRHSIKD